MSFLTDFADQAVLLPLALVIGLLLAASGWRRGAMAWGIAVISTLAVMLGLKLVFAACTINALDPALRSPSGHTAAATLVYGGLLGLLARRGWRGALVAGCAIAVVIGFSRVWLGLHTRAEAVLGGLVGTAGAVLMAMLAGVPPPGLRGHRLIAASLAIVVLAHGLHLQAEPLIRALGYEFAWLVPFCGG